MAFADIDGIKLKYEVTGDGPPVLMIMGYSMPGHAWRFQAPALSEHHTVCVFDNRGAGQSGKPDGPYTMQRLAQDAVDLIDHLGWQTAHIVGVSMGGMVAQHVALEHRERVKSLALIATHAGGLAQRLPTARGLWQFARGVLGPRGGRLDATARLLFPKAYREEVGHAYLMEVLSRDFSEKPPKSGRRGQLKAVFGHDTRDRLGELADLRTLIFSPERDLLVRSRWNHFIHARIPGSQLISIPNAGHGVVRQCPDILNPALLAHFGDGATATARATGT